MIDWTTLYCTDTETMDFNGQSTPCQIWRGVVSPKGYGSLPRNVHGTGVAHRAMFVERGGVIPEGHELDHTCRVRICVRHLEAVSPQENKRRGLARRGVGRGERVDHHAASLAAQRGDWTAYRLLARIDADPLPLKAKPVVSMTPALSARWVKALRRDRYVGGTGSEGDMVERSALEILAAEMPAIELDRLGPAFAPLIPVERVHGALRAKVLRLVGGEETVSFDALDATLYRDELADVLEMAFA